MSATKSDRIIAFKDVKCTTTFLLLRSFLNFLFRKEHIFFKTIKKQPSQSLFFFFTLIILYTFTFVVMSKSQVFQLKVMHHSMLEVCAMSGIINSVKVLCVRFN